MCCLLWVDYDIDGGKYGRGLEILGEECMCGVCVGWFCWGGCVCCVGGGCC